MVDDVDRDAAQPAGETAALGIERAHPANRRQPGILHDVVGQVAQAGAAPEHVRIQPGKRFLVPGAPGLLIAGQDGAAQAEFTPDTVAGGHATVPGGLATTWYHTIAE